MKIVPSAAVVMLTLLVGISAPCYGHWDDKMTTERLYQGVVVELSLRVGGKRTQKDIKSAGEATRYLNGYADALRFGDDDTRHELADAVKSFLDKNPLKKKKDIREVMAEVLAFYKSQKGAAEK